MASTGDADLGPWEEKEAKLVIDNMTIRRSLYSGCVSITLGDGSRAKFVVDKHIQATMFKGNNKTSYTLRIEDTRDTEECFVELSLWCKDTEAAKRVLNQVLQIIEP